MFAFQSRIALGFTKNDPASVKSPRMAKQLPPDTWLVCLHDRLNGELWHNKVKIAECSPVLVTTDTILGISWTPQGISVHEGGQVKFSWMSSGCDRHHKALADVEGPWSKDLRLDPQTDQLWAVVEIVGANKIEIVPFYPTGRNI